MVNYFFTTLIFEIVASLLVGFGLFFYSFVYPRKRINLLLLLIVISLVPTISIFRPGIYEAGNMAENIQIATSYYESLIEGNIFPVWNAFSFMDYGSAQHEFQYPLPYFLLSILHIIGIPMLFSMKLYLAATFILSGITMFVFIKDYGKIAAFVSSLFYLFAPYHLIELHFRASVGILAAFVFIPLLFLFINKIYIRRTLRNLILVGVSFGLLILSQAAAAYLILNIVIVYIFFLLLIDKRNIMNLIWTLISLFFGFCLVGFYIIPALVESIYHVMLSKIDTLFFYPFLSYISSPTVFGFLFQSRTGETHWIIGYPHLIVVFIALILLIKYKLRTEADKMLFLLVVFFFFYVFMTQPISTFIWRLPYFRSVLDTFKVLVPIVFITSFIPGLLIYKLESFGWFDKYFKKYLIKKFRKIPNFKFNLLRLNINKDLIINNSREVVIFLICIFLIFSTILNWGNRRTLPYDYEHLRHFWTFNLPLKDSNAWTTWFVPGEKWVYEYPKVHAQVISGKGEIKDIFRNTTRHEYLIKADIPVKVRENTIYWPGWKVIVNGNYYTFDYQYSPYSGLITFELEEGLHKIDVVLEDTIVRKLGKLVSIASLVFIFSAYFLKRIIVRRIFFE